MKNLNALDWIAIILLIVGGLNWGLVGIFSFDLVAAIFGDMSLISRIVYILVAISGIYILFSLGKLAKRQLNFNLKKEESTKSRPCLVISNMSIEKPKFYKND